MAGGIVSKTFGRWHALGPYLYLERGGFMLHFYARWFRLPEQQGWHWGASLRLRDRFVFFR
jgi:hypothetical protein